MKIQAKGKRLAVQLMTEETSEGGIIIPEQAKKNHSVFLRGVVETVGEEVEGYQEGDLICFTKCEPVRIGREDWYFPSKEQVLCVIE